MSRTKELFMEQREWEEIQYVNSFNRRRETGVDLIFTPDEIKYIEYNAKCLKNDLESYDGEED